MAGTAVHEGLVAGPRVTGGDLTPPVAVELHQPPRPLDHPGQRVVLIVARQLTDRRPRRAAGEEHRLGEIERADPGEDALVQQRLTDRPIRLRAKGFHHSSQVPVRAEHVGPEMTH